MHLVFNIAYDPTTQQDTQPGGSQQNAQVNPDRAGKLRLGDNLYATHCSTLHFNCVTAYTSVPEALHGEAATIAVCTFSGAGLGILSAMAFSFMFERSLDLCKQLRRDLERDKLQVAYQPIVDFASRRVVGAEALARWADEEGNVVGPDVFIKLAEDNGFIGMITKRVLHRALHDFAKILHSRPSLRLSINVAAADLSDPEFLPMIEDALKRFKVQPKHLVLEITERATANSAAAMETIRVLRHRGHSIHIDDFGTGYSNLDRLLYLFADTIKIDKAFTRVIGTESVAVAILPQILAMARSLNLEVIIEGVETERQADYFALSTEKLYGQGFLYGDPVGIEEFQGLLADGLAKPRGVPSPVIGANGTAGSLHIVNSRSA
jgi:sensor c-di-GMP phosphodiesterase-like protein